MARAAKTLDAAPEDKPVTLNDIGQRTVNSTTTILTAPDGSIATVHLGWIVTVNPLDDEGDGFLMDEDGQIGDQDRELLEDGAYVLSHGCDNRDWYHVESDPTAVRGYATAAAANMLLAYVNKFGREPRFTTEARTSPDDTKNAADPTKSPNDSAGSTAASGPIPNTNVTKDDSPPVGIKAEPTTKR